MVCFVVLFLFSIFPVRNRDSPTSDNTSHFISSGCVFLELAYLCVCFVKVCNYWNITIICKSFLKQLSFRPVFLCKGKIISFYFRTAILSSFFSLFLSAGSLNYSALTFKYFKAPK